MNIVKRMGEHDPTRVAFISKDRSIDYGELTYLVAKTASRLQHLAGHAVVAVDMVDGINSVIVRLALAQLGCAPVPLMMKMGIFEVQTRWQLSGASHLITDFDAPGNPLPTTVIKDLEQEIEGYEIRTEYATGGDYPLFVCWSGGTHGTPDALTHSHSSIIAMADYSPVWAGNWVDDKVYCMAPMHTAFFSMYLGIHIYLGGTMVIEEGAFSPMSAASTIINHGITHFGTTPALYSMLLRRESLTKEQVPAICLVAGDAVPVQLVRAWESKYDVTLRTCLASSQTGPITFRTSRDQPTDSVGRLLPGVELKLLDENGNEVPAGEAGEAWFRSLQNAVRDKTPSGTSSLRDGWITAHDILRQTADGIVYFMGRSRDTFKVNGYFVNPKKIEDRVRDVPGVQDAAAVAQLDEHGLKRVKVYVVTTEAAVDKERVELDIREIVSDLDSHERVRHVEFIEEIPRHPMSQKVQKFRLTATE